MRKLDLDKAISILKDYFRVEEMDYVLFDRENGFVVEQSGREADGVHYNQYPNGLQPRLLDPNIGQDKTNIDQDAIWSSQISFEE